MTKETGRRLLGATIWAYAVWTILTWTATVENLSIGLAVALAAGAVATLTGAVARPWLLLDPRRLWAAIWLFAVVCAGVARANLAMLRLIWGPSRLLASGMVIAPTKARTDGEVAAVGIATSLVVDNQLIDLDRSTRRLQFHSVALPPTGEDCAYDAINAPVERPLLSLTRR